MRRAADPDARSALQRVSARIRSYGAERVVVAFSGGVDSSVVLALAARALGPDRVTAVTAVSPSYPEGELEQAAALARSLGTAHRATETWEVERESYARNEPDRCFHCKTELYATLRRLARAEARSGAIVLAGANADDLGDFRPGLRAAEEQHVRNPLLEERMGKEAVRGIARSLGLPVADKPALACLSSRVAYGIRITPGLLGRIDRAEREVRALGFDVVRVRHHGDDASIEVPRDRVDALLAHPGLAEVTGRLEAMGWRRVRVDPAGYRTGSLNEVIGTGPAAKD